MVLNTPFNHLCPLIFIFILKRTGQFGTQNSTGPGGLKVPWVTPAPGARRHHDDALAEESLLPLSIESGSEYRTVKRFCLLRHNPRYVVLIIVGHLELDRRGISKVPVHLLGVQ